MFVCSLEGGSSSSIPIDYVLLTYSRAVDTSSQAYARSTTSNMSRDQYTEPCLESYSLRYVRTYVDDYVLVLTVYRRINHSRPFSLAVTQTESDLGSSYFPTFFLNSRS